MKKGNRILLVGEPMALLTAETAGELSKTDGFSLSVAGAEYNVAVGLARLGHHPVYCTRLGHDPFGEKIAANMRENQIDMERVSWDTKRQTGMMLKGRVVQEGDDPDIFYFRKNSAASSFSEELVENWSLEGYDALHITGIFSALNESTYRTVQRLAEKARQAEIPVFFDPNLRPSLWSSEEQMRQSLQNLAALADVVLPGIKEGRILTGKEHPEEIAQVYHEMGVKAVILKIGSEGAFYSLAREDLSDREKSGEPQSIRYNAVCETAYVSGFQAEQVIDTVGAGDGFAVGVLSGLLEELSEPHLIKQLLGRRNTDKSFLGQLEMAVRKAVERGNAIGCIQVMHRGDNEGLPTRAELDVFFSRQREQTGAIRASKAQITAEELNQRLWQLRVVPVIQLAHPEQGVPLARALLAGGLPVAEITFRTAAAEEAIRQISQELPEVLLLAGTVLDVETARRAVEAGASAIVSPGTNPEVVTWCLEHHIPVLPGCATPTELEACRRMGLHTVKFFPAEAAGGVKMLRALAGPYHDMSFMPTGGINPENLGSYLELPHVVACGGSYMVPGDLLERGDYEKIQELVVKTVQEL